MVYTVKKYRPLYNGILRCDDNGVVMFGDSDYAFDRKYKDRSSEFGSGLSTCIRVNTKQLWWQRWVIVKEKQRALFSFVEITI